MLERDDLGDVGGLQLGRRDRRHDAGAPEQTATVTGPPSCCAAAMASHEARLRTPSFCSATTRTLHGQHPILGASCGISTCADWFVDPRRKADFTFSPPYVRKVMSRGSSTRRLSFRRGARAPAPWRPRAASRPASVSAWISAARGSSRCAAARRRRQRHGHRRGLHLFLLRRHDALERRVAELVDAALNREHGRQRHRDPLEPAALELALHAQVTALP